MLYHAFLISFLSFPLLSKSQIQDPLSLHALLSRQAPGSPAYECHASCGGVITAGRKPTAQYCTDATFAKDLPSCLQCANTYNVWSSYGTSVTKAATACNLQASPSPSVASAATSSAAETSAHNHGGNSTVVATSVLSTGTREVGSSGAAATSAANSAAAATTSATAAGSGVRKSCTVNGISLSILAVLSFLM